MPHFPKPFFKKSRGSWYVEIDRKQINLGTDQAEAFRRYHQLTAQPRRQTLEAVSLLGLIDAFQSWCKELRVSCHVPEVSDSPGSFRASLS